MFTLADIISDAKQGMTILELHKKYGGFNIYIPRTVPNYKELIITDFNGNNYDALSHKYSVTINNIKSILRKSKSEISTLTHNDISQNGSMILSDKEELFYNNQNLTFKTVYTFDLAHLKAVYDVGVDELLKSDYPIGLEIPKGYTFNDFIDQVKQDHVHTPDSLQEHLQSLLSDMVRLLEHTQGNI